MASSFSDLGIELMATGENAGTWGTKTNTNLQIVEKSIAGYVEKAITSGGTTALTITDGDATESTSVARHAVIKLTGTITGNSIVTVPDSIEKVYIVVNGTSGAYTVQFKTASGTGVTFGASDKGTKLVFSDGTNIVDTATGNVGTYDLNGETLILDADQDTNITADTDDQIDIAIAGADDFQFTANTFTAVSGSTIATNTIAETTSGSGVTIDGTLVKDGAITNTSLVVGRDADNDIDFATDNNILFRASGADQIKLVDGALAPVTDNDVDLGTSSLEFKDAFFDGTINADALAADSATLAGTLEIDVASGDPTIILDTQGADKFHIAVDDSDSDNLVIKSGGTVGSGNGLKLDSSGNLTVTGDLTVSGDDITMGTNTSGNILVADGTNFNSLAVGDLSEISTIANDDVFLAVDTSGGGLKKVARSAVVAGLATSGAISNVVEDTTPQLGGNLDMNGADIVTTSNADLELAPNGTGHVTVRGNTNSGAIQLNCESNSHGQIIKAQPHSAGVTNEMLLPDGSSSTLVSLVATQTLTNKTLTTPVIAEIDSGSTITLDATTDIILDADGANITLKDGGTTVLDFVLNGATDVTLDAPGDIKLDADGGDFNFLDGGTEILRISNSSSDVIIRPVVDAKDLIFQQADGTEVARIEDNATFNVVTGKLAINGTAITSTAAELNLLDGVSGLVQADLTKLAAVDATATELNIMDGDTSATSTTLADADRLVTNDAGTMKQVALTDVKTYLSSAGFSTDDPTALAIALG